MSQVIGDLQLGVRLGFTFSIGDECAFEIPISL